MTEKNEQCESYASLWANTAAKPR